MDILEIIRVFIHRSLYLMNNANTKCLTHLNEGVVGFTQCSVVHG
jgi:hypothetical protein